MPDEQGRVEHQLEYAHDLVELATQRERVLDYLGFERTEQVIELLCKLEVEDAKDREDGADALNHVQDRDDGVAIPVIERLAQSQQPAEMVLEPLLQPSLELQVVFVQVKEAAVDDVREDVLDGAEQDAERLL